MHTPVHTPALRYFLATFEEKATMDRLERRTVTRKSILLAITLSLCTLASGVRGATLSLAPTASDVTPGSTISLDLVVSGLADMGAPSLSAFDLILTFEPANLAFISYSLGESLGNLGVFDALDIGLGEVAPGVLNLAEASFLTAPELDALQSGSFLLATIDFMVVALGVGDSTTVNIGPVFGLADGTSSPIAVTAASGATLTGAIIPLPGAAWLFVSSVLALCMGLRQRQ